jgi:hypothetical protein
MVIIPTVSLILTRSSRVGVSSLQLVFLYVSCVSAVICVSLRLSLSVRVWQGEICFLLYTVGSSQVFRSVAVFCLYRLLCSFRYMVSCFPLFSGYAGGFFEGWRFIPHVHLRIIATKFQYARLAGSN